MAQPILTYLQKSELESIHNASTRILEKTGIKFPCKEALDVFSEGGADVDYNTSIVKIPSKMVEDALAKAPKEINFYARDSQKDIKITDFSRRWPVFGVMMASTGILDMKTKKRRPTTLKDVTDICRIIDACNEIDISESPASPTDVPLEVTWTHAYNTMFKNFTKPVVLTPERLSRTQDVIRMGMAVAGGESEFKKRPLITMIVLTVPPLNNDTDVIESVLEALKYNIQIRISPGTMAGASAPASLAGLIAQGNAEALSWLVLVQLINPGNEFVLGQNPRIMDMRYGTVSLSSPEWALMRGALGDLGRFYNLPIQAFQQVTAAKVIDAQAGYEKTMTGLMSGLGGLNVAMGNIMDSQNLCCKADYPFTNEIIGAIRRILRGFEVNEETLAVDLVDEIAHKRDYMRTKHTMKHYKENWMPTLLERRMWQEWHDEGEKDMWDRLVERAEDILANHKIEPLSQNVCDEIDAITEEAESKLGSK